MATLLILGISLYEINKPSYEAFLGHTSETHPINLSGWSLNSFRGRSSWCGVSFIICIDCTFVLVCFCQYKLRKVVLSSTKADIDVLKVPRHGDIVTEVSAKANKL